MASTISSARRANVAIHVTRTAAAGTGGRQMGGPVTHPIAGPDGPDTLSDSTVVSGFVCEAHAVRRAQEITHPGGWRAYVDAIASSDANPPDRRSANNVL